MLPLPQCVRRSVGTVLLAVYVVVAAGIPLPTVRKSFNGDGLYPCAKSGCGCDSADKCWRSCCCHTLAERLQWAAKNSVKPPEFALVAAKEAGLNVNGERITPRIIQARLASKSDCGAKKCCCSTHAKTCCKAHSEAHEQQDAKMDFIVAWRAMSCHGQSLQWLAAIPSLISVEMVSFDSLMPASWLGPHSTDEFSSFCDVPTPPPPERV